MRKDIFPMTHELRHVWITGDKKLFLDRKKAKAHQKKLEDDAEMLDALEGLPSI